MELALTSAQFSYRTAEKPQLSLDALSLTSGSHWVVVGPNGSGKSTLLQLLAGRLTPQTGSLALDGRRLGQELTPPQFFQQVAFATQDAEESLVASLVKDEVAFGPRNLGLDPATVAHRVQESLVEVGLEALSSQRTDSLSGGQLQRLQLAGLLALDPQFLLLDEITSSLNAAAAHTIRHLLSSGAPASCGQLLSTHDLVEVCQADKALLMHDGRIHRILSPQQLFEDEDLWQLMGYHCSFLGQVARTLALAQMPVSSITDPESCLQAWRQAGFSVPALPPTPTTHPDASAGLTLSHVTLKSETSTLLDDVSLEVPAGQITLLLGASGAGKTCTCRLAAGLLSADKGQVCLQGRPVEAGMVAYSAQRSEDMLFCNSVAEDVAFGPRLAGLSGQALENRVAEAFEAVGFDASLAQRSPYELSGGQRRKAALAAVIAQQAPALICDEPCANLDPWGVAHILKALAAQARKGVAVLVTTHDPEPWLQVAHHVVILEAGAVAWQGAPWELEDKAPLAASAAGEPLALRLRRELGRAAKASASDPASKPLRRTSGDTGGAYDR